jgi:cytochrome c-type biogenesis protein CcmF
LALAIAAVLLGYAMQSGKSALGPIGLGLGVWVLAGAITDLWMRTGKGSLSNRVGRLSRLPRADWGKVTAHSGMGITVFAVAAMTAWVTEDIRVVKIGETYPLGRYEITLVDVRDVAGPNYVSTMAEMRVTASGADVITLYPEKRYYPVAEMPTTEAAIDYGIWRDLYLVIGEKQAEGGYAVRGYIKPFANWLWGGTIIMALGGLLSLTDRRFRIAAGAKQTRLKPQPAE